MEITVGQATDMLEQLFTILLAGGAIYLGVRKWVKKIARENEQAARQLKTSNGKTVADYVEGTAKDLASINVHINSLTAATQENRDRAVRAEAMAENAHRRLDTHLIHDHGFPVTSHNNEEN